MDTYLKDIEPIIIYAFSLSNSIRRYQFSGESPLEGMDCSSFCCELMRAAGELPNARDLSAQGLFDYFKPMAQAKCEMGALSFYGKNVMSITHVGFHITDKLMLNLSGGDSKTVSDIVAIQQKAYTKMRPIRYRSDYLCSLLPPYSLLRGI